jgi:propanediol dehydratase small subunit
VSKKLTTRDYPLAEKRPDLVRTRHGKKLEDLTLDALEAGSVALEDLRITPEFRAGVGAGRRAAGCNPRHL